MYRSEQSTSVTLFGTWLAFEFIHVTFLFSSLLSSFHFLSFSLSISFPFSTYLLLTVAQTGRENSRSLYIILYTNDLSNEDHSLDSIEKSLKKEKKLPISLA